MVSETLPYSGRRRLNLVLATDQRFRHGCAVTIRSLLDNLRAASSVRITILHDSLKPQDADAIRRTCADARHDVECSFVVVPRERLEGLIRSKDISRMSYARLLLSDVLPEDATRCLYLDTDLIVELDLGELHDLDLGGAIVGAVPNGEEDDDARHFRRLGVAGRRYFNSGVLAVDLQRWREEEVGERALRFCREGGDRLHMHDQDALNAVLAHEWTEVPSRWNTWASRRRDGAPCVLHLTMVPKPWHADYAGPNGELFFRYLDRTVYAGWRPPRLLGVAPMMVRLRRKIPYLPTVVRKLRLAVGAGRA